MAVSGNPGGKVSVVDDVLSSHEHEIYPTTSLVENCIEFEFQTDRNYYVDLRQTYLAFKLKLVKGRGYETYKTKEVRKEHKEETKAEEEETVEEEPLSLVTHENNILHSKFSNVEVYISNQQIYYSNGLYAHKSYISNNLKGAIFEYKRVLHCEGSDYEEFPDEIMEAPLSEPFLTRRMKLLSRPDGFMLYGKLGVNFFSTSELLDPNMKIRLQLIRARPNFYMISDNPNVSLGIVDCSIYTRRIALKSDYHKKRMHMLAYTPVVLSYLETIAKFFIIPARQNQFIQENIFNNAPIRRIAIAMNTNSAFTGSYTENPFRYQQFELRQIRILRGSQPIVDFDATDKCRLYVTTMKAMNFQDDIPSIPIDNLKDHYVLVFDLTSIQDATENCHYPKLVGEPLRLELNFTFTLEHVTELIVLGERMSSVAVDKFGVVGKNIWSGKCFSSTTNHSSPITQVSVPWLFSLWLCSNSWQWHYCPYKHATEQYAGWALDNNCKLLSKIVFCRLSWSKNVQIPQAAIWTDDARSTGVSPKCLRLLYKICSFSALQVSTRRNYRSSRC